MHHVPLDWSRSDDRHFNHQIVKLRGFMRGRNDIWARLSTWKHAQQIRLAEHVVDDAILRRHGREIVIPPVMPPQQIEALANAAQHTERSRHRS